MFSLDFLACKPEALFWVSRTSGGAAKASGESAKERTRERERELVRSYAAPPLVSETAKASLLAGYRFL